MAAAASAKSGTRNYEIRLAGFAGHFDSWLPVPDLLAVATVPTDYTGGAPEYAALLEAAPESTSDGAVAASDPTPGPTAAPTVGLIEKPAVSAVASTNRRIDPLPEPEVPVLVPRPQGSPGQGPVRVVIHHRTGDAAAVARARELQELLAADRGFNVEIRSVSVLVSADNIRIFFESDRQKARNTRDLVASGPIPIRNFSDYRPLPRPGTIEIWLAAMPSVSAALF